MKKDIIVADDLQQECIISKTGRAILHLNEKAVETIETDSDGNETAKTQHQYDLVILDGPVADETEALEALKAAVIEEITEYDNSTAVNEFTLYGAPLWFDKAKRVGLVNLINSQKSTGEANTVLADNGVKYEIPVDAALQMLAVLEVYAGKCYNVTDTHKANVEKLTTFSDVINYDYKSGYPEHVEFVQQ